jgi:hypothetical protein
MGEPTNSYQVMFTVDNLTKHRSRELEGWLRSFPWARDVKVMKVNSVMEHIRNTLRGPVPVRSHERRDSVPTDRMLPSPEPQKKPQQTAVVQKPQQKANKNTKYEYVDGQLVQDNRKFR